MKEIIGLLVFICIAIVAIYLSVAKRIDYKLTLVLLLFSILAGFTVANYDIIKRLKWGDFELETAKKELEGVKNYAIQEIKGEVKTQKESMELVIRDANSIAIEIKKQKKEVNSVVKTAKALQNKIEERKKEIISLNEETERTKKELVNLNLAAQQTALTLIKTTYLTLSTKNEIGSSPRLKKVTQEIENDINRILPMVIPNNIERSQWINNLKNILPSRN